MPDSEAESAPGPPCPAAFADAGADRSALVPQVYQQRRKGLAPPTVLPRSATDTSARAATFPTVPDIREPHRSGHRARSDRRARTGFRLAASDEAPDTPAR